MFCFPMVVASYSLQRRRQPPPPQISIQSQMLYFKEDHNPTPAENKVHLELARTTDQLALAYHRLCLKIPQIRPRPLRRDTIP